MGTPSLGPARSFLGADHIRKIGHPDLIMVVEASIAISGFRAICASLTAAGAGSREIVEKPIGPSRIGVIGTEQALSGHHNQRVTAKRTTSTPTIRTNTRRRRDCRPGDRVTLWCACPACGSSRLPTFAELLGSFPRFFRLEVIGGPSCEYPRTMTPDPAAIFGLR